MAKIKMSWKCFLGWEVTNLVGVMPKTANNN